MNKVRFYYGDTLFAGKIIGRKENSYLVELDKNSFIGWEFTVAPIIDRQKLRLKPYHKYWWVYDTEIKNESFLNIE